MKNEIVKLGVVLLVITSIAAGILAISNNITADVIVKAEEEAVSGPDVAREVVPGCANFEDFEDQNLISEIKGENEKFIDIKYAVDENGEILGYAVRTLSTVAGYGGDIEVFVGISNDNGEITCVKVLSMSETPGLGTKVQEEEFKGQFVGKTTDLNLEVVKSEASEENEIEAVAGATVSSNSYTSAVNNALDIYEEYIE